MKKAFPAIDTTEIREVLSKKIEIIKKDVALKQSYVFFILHYYNFRDLFLIIIFLILLVFFLWGFFHEERTQLIQTVER